MNKKGSEERKKNQGGSKEEVKRNKKDKNDVVHADPAGDRPARRRSGGSASRADWRSGTGAAGRIAFHYMPYTWIIHLNLTESPRIACVVGG